MENEFFRREDLRSHADTALATSGHAGPLQKACQAVDERTFAFSPALVAGSDMSRTLEALVLDESCDLAESDCYALRWACTRGHLGIVTHLLGKLTSLSASASCAAITGASAKGHLAVVDELLRDGRFDAAAEDQLPIRLAAQAGYTGIVSRLMRDPRVDPSAADNDAVCLSAEGAHLSVVQQLLSDPRVDASARDNEPVRWACAKGHMPLLELLLDDARVDPGKDYSAPVRQRYFRGDIDAPIRGSRRLQMVNPLFDHQAPRNRCIRLAADLGHKDVCERLLLDWRVWRQYDEEGIDRAIQLLSDAGRWPSAGALMAAFRGLARRTAARAQLRPVHLPRPDAAPDRLRRLAWERRRAAVIARLASCSGPAGFAGASSSDRE